MTDREPELTLPVIEGRGCGGCTVCCVVMPVDEPSLRKQAGVACAQCSVGEGCRIYEARPQTCRDWFCGWRVLPKLGEAWRPDRSGVLITFDDADIPPGWTVRPAFKLVVTGGREALRSPAFAEYVAGLVVARIPVFLSVPGPEGHFFAKAFLNERLGWPVERRDRGAIQDVLEAVYRVLEAGPFDPVTLSGPPFSP